MKDIIIILVAILAMYILAELWQTALVDAQAMSLIELYATLLYGLGMVTITILTVVYFIIKGGIR